MAYNFNRLISSIQSRGGVSYKRFPIVMIFAWATTLIAIQYDNFTESILLNYVLLGYLGFLFSLNAKIAIETFEIKKQYQYVIYFGILGFLFGYYQIIPTDFNYDECFNLLTFGIIAVLHLMLAIMPFLKTKGDQLLFTNYNLHIFNSWIKAFLYGLVLFWALALALLALDKLFGVIISGDAYAKLFVFIAGVFHTTFFLSEFPDKENFEGKMNQDSGTFKILTTYVLVPVVFLYSLILYLYIGKLIFSAQSIESWVRYLIIWYFVFGVLSYLFSTFYVKENRGLLYFFKKWFFIFSAPLLILYMVSVWKEVAVEGLYEESYFLLSLGVWLFVVSAYIIFSKKDNPKIFPTTLIILCVVLFFSGPFSACNVCVSNQQHKLIEDFNKIGLIKNGQLIYDSKNKVVDSLNIFRNKIYYLQQRNALPFLIDYDTTEAVNQLITIGNVEEFLRKLNIVQYYDTYNQDNFRQINLFFEQNTETDIQGFERILPIKTIYRTVSSPNRVEVDKNNLILVLDGKNIDTFSLKGVESQLNQNASPPLNTFLLESEDYLLKIVVQNLYGEVVNEVTNYTEFNGLVLLKTK